MLLQYNALAAPSRAAFRRIALICGLTVTSILAAGFYDSPSPAETAPEAEPHPVPIAQGIPMRNAVVPAAALAPGAVDGLIQSALNDSLRVPEPNDWKTVHINYGQSLSNIFDALDLPSADWMAILRLGGDAGELRHLTAGTNLSLRIGEDSLDELTYPLDELRTLDIRRGAHGFEAVTLTSAIEHRTTEVAGTIESSLFLDAHRAKLSDRLILQFAEIFDYDIDFAQDLQPGDHFSVVYDVLYKNGRRLRDGDIVAAEFVNEGHSYRAARFVDSSGHGTYYTPDGQSLRKAFIRTPVDFARISSGFNLHRMHPILNIIRAHKGVDYAAPTGTPIKATGDGRIEFEGQKSGYGNFIIIKHPGPYETAYGHMSRFKTGLHEGSAVHLGQVIGYVGMTGLATAPHLHYEFRVNGVHQNPVTASLPRAIPLGGTQLAQFHRQTAPLLAQLESPSSHRLASNSP